MTEEAPKKPLNPPSDEFTEAFSARIGSISGTCEFCGRTYFSDQGYGYDEGELEELRRKAAENPDKFIEWEGGPGFVDVDGRHWVVGCECNAPRRYEDWIWAHRWKIADYLKARAAGRMAEAKEFEAAVRDIPSLLENVQARRVENDGPKEV